MENRGERGGAVKVRMGLETGWGERKGIPEGKREGRAKREKEVKGTRPREGEKKLEHAESMRLISSNLTRAKIKSAGKVYSHVSAICRRLKDQDADTMQHRYCASARYTPSRLPAQCLCLLNPTLHCQRPRSLLFPRLRPLRHPS